MSRVHLHIRTICTYCLCRCCLLQFSHCSGEGAEGLLVEAEVRRDFDQTAILSFGVLDRELQDKLDLRSQWYKGGQPGLTKDRQRPRTAK